MGTWQKRTIKLDKNFPIPKTAKPGNNIFVANRGEVSFEYPKDWIVKPSDQSICFYDAEPPADQCMLEFSILPLDFAVDWSKLPLEEMIRQAVGAESGSCEPANIRTLRRGEIKIVWLEHEFMEPVEKRPAISRCGLASRADVMALITFNFWPEHRDEAETVWSGILETLRLAEGPRFKTRN